MQSFDLYVGKTDKKLVLIPGCMKGGRGMVPLYKILAKHTTLV